MTSALEVNYEHLNLLLKASNKQQVSDICQKAFDNKDKETISNTDVSTVMEMLNLENSNSVKGLIQALGNLIKIILFHEYCTSESVMALFPNEFHKNLRELISKIIAENFPLWKNKTVSNLVSLPKLVDFDWRVDLKMASGKVARMNEPTCILHLKIEDPTVQDKGKLSTLNVELSKETLDTILNSLGKIRDQLSAVAKK